MAEDRDETERDEETPRPSPDEERERDEELDEAARKAEETRKRAKKRSKTSSGRGPNGGGQMPALGARQGVSPPALEARLTLEVRPWIELADPVPPRTGRTFNGNGDDGDPSVALALEVSLDAPDALLVEAAGLFSPRRTPAVSAWPRQPADRSGKLICGRHRVSIFIFGEELVESAARLAEGTDVPSDVRPGGCPFG